MPHRELSPTASENEVDITGALFQDGSLASSDGEVETQHPDRKAQMQTMGSMPDMEEDLSDDEGYIADTQAAANRKTSNLKGRSVKKGGGFQAMGLNAHLLKAITRKGFSVPTPIQRKAIPMILDGQDVVGMARTGSGKTAAFVVPMIEKLKGHSAKVGARALVLSPSRELALQTLKVVKELGKGTDLRCVLLVGGDSLEEQFGSMSANPDTLIATPGRFLHLKVEMGLDLSSVRYVVFDEADRLFEMGFAAQLTEILHALPPSRQTLLFSATLPKSLVEFARAGLQGPSLVRLDAESKISPDLQSAFFTLKSAEKEGALLHILSEIIRIPTGQTDTAIRAKEEASMSSRKRKRGAADGAKPHESPTKHSTIVFASTKHHVEYLATLLRESGFAVSHAYGSLDQTARKIQVQDFRTGMTNILVVTDVAARGIDIPVLANVINYDFPPQPKIFVHRVGRTARAGQRGWSYSLVRTSDAPYLLDLQLFLGKLLRFGQDEGAQVNYAEDVVAGSLVQDRIASNCEWVSKMLDEDTDLQALRSVAAKGEKLYLRTRNSASSESARRAKEVTGSKAWLRIHPLFADEANNAEVERAKMLARVSGFRPQETVFEIGKRGAGGQAAEIMKKRRITIDKQRHKNAALQRAPSESPEPSANPPHEDTIIIDEPNLSDASTSSLQVTLSNPTTTTKDPTYKSSHYMSYTPTTLNTAEDRAYGVHTGGTSTTNFLSTARTLTLDLTTDDHATKPPGTNSSTGSGKRWDKKAKKYVALANDTDGSKGTKYIKGESGQKIAASFRSGRFDAWRKAKRVGRLPRTGEAESNIDASGAGERGGRGRVYRHREVRAPKEADRYRDDFYGRRKRVERAREERVGRFRDGAGRGEVKGVEDVRRERGVKERGRERSGRGGGGKGGGARGGGRRGRGRERG